MNYENSKSWGVTQKDNIDMPRILVTAHIDANEPFALARRDNGPNSGDTHAAGRPEKDNLNDFAKLRHSPGRKLTPCSVVSLKTYYML